jgi:uncharacterized protein YbaR (Trm112 family)
MSSNEEMPVTLHPLLLEVLVCPECKSTVTLDSTSNELVCDDCGLIYPIRDGIPIMLVSAARRPDGESADDLADLEDLAADVDEPSDDGSGAQPTDD